MLAPLRDYLCPSDPKSFPLLCTARDCYFRRLSVNVGPSIPGFEEARWIVLEDVNVEHLLKIFATIDTPPDNIWDVCGHFMEHLCWHKRRLVMLGPIIEGLPDDHPSKPQCLFQLSGLFDAVGNRVERKRLLVWALKLWRECGGEFEVARTLRFLSGANQLLGLLEEGTRQVEEALAIYKRLDSMSGQVLSL